MSSISPLSSLPGAFQAISLNAPGDNHNQDDPATFSTLLVGEMVRSLHKTAGVFARPSTGESPSLCQNGLAGELLSQWLGGKLAEQLGGLPGMPPQPAADSDDFRQPPCNHH